MFELDCRHLVPAEYLTSIDAAMAGQHSEVRVHQHRNIEAEGLNATRNLADLSWAVHTRVVGVQLQLAQRSVDDRDAAFRLVLRSVASLIPHVCDVTANFEIAATG